MKPSRLYNPIEQSPVLSGRQWPCQLEATGLYGIAGDFVRKLEPHTEADPVAILVQFLVGFGNLIGRAAHFVVEDKKQFCNVNVVLVGATAKGRKGVSWGRVNNLLTTVDSTWQIPASGMSTGEGIIWAVRDPIMKTKSDGKEETVDGGAKDKRLLIVEEEFSRVLRCASREGNTLSAVFRQAFDSGNLRILNKTSPAQSTEAHVSLIGHITEAELSRTLTETDCANGFANRIIWPCVRRSKLLPDGGKSHLENFSGIELSLKSAVAFAGKCGELKRDGGAGGLWRDAYPGLSNDKPGLAGAVTSRAEAYVLRLSMLYALLDCSSLIRLEHLRAALSVWRYCEESARYIFGASVGDQTADAILAGLRNVASPGMTRTEISQGILKKNRGKEEIDRALELLKRLGLARCELVETDGRPAERWYHGNL